MSFEHRHAAHCESGAIANLLQHHGIAMTESLAFGLAGALYLAYFIYGGFVWMTAGGEAEKVKTAQKVIIRSVTGVTIVLFSYTLLTVLLALMSRIQGS